MVAGGTLVAVWGSIVLGALLVRTLGVEVPPTATVVLLGVGEIALILPVAWLVRRYRFSWKAVGWRAPVSTWREVAAALGHAFFWGYLALLVWGLILLPFGLRAQQNPLPVLVGKSPLALGVTFVVVVGVGPVAEEAFFRGFLFTTLQAYAGTRTAYVVSAFLFALFHFQVLAFPPLFVLGLLLAHLYRRTGSIWPPVVFHSVINGLTLVVWTMEFFAR